MKVIGLNGREYNLDMKKYLVQRKKCSQYHKAARELLADLFCGYHIYEEVKLPGTINPAKKAVLYLDFFIPNAKLAVEVHGRQHFEFIPYFHKTKAGFLQSKARDHNKEEWCRINDISLEVLRFDESPEEWEKQFAKY